MDGKSLSRQPAYGNPVGAALFEKEVNVTVTSLYLTGGQQRAPRPLIADPTQWYEYQQGLILEVDTQTKEVTTRLSYVSPPDACAAQDPEILFKSAFVQDNTFYACTQTEVLLFSLPHFAQTGYISLPCFNDVHHVRPTSCGTLLVANSGLDMVLEISLDGQVLRLWNTLGEDPWARFSLTTDYRKGVSTKPHQSHPNYVFTIGDDVWATRFQQKDAVCLTKPERTIVLGMERVHDGVLHDNHLYFTAVNGQVIVVDPSRLVIEDIVDLNAMHDPGTLLGWCRGLLIEKSRLWVGFSRIRATKFRENVGWVAHGFKRVAPTHIACYDLALRRCIAEIEVEQFGLSAVFSILPVVDSALDASDTLLPRVGGDLGTP